MKGVACLSFLLGAAVVSSLSPDSSDEAPVTRAGGDCNCGWVNKGRIVGGQEAQKNMYPLIASIEDILGLQFCGGTVISQWHVLTAAHCTHGRAALNTKIRVGAHRLSFLQREGESYMISKIINHAGYNDQTTANDIALLVTRSRIKFTQNVGPACLPVGRPNLAGQRITAIGWGTTTEGGKSAKYLQEVSLRVIPNVECKRWWYNLNPATQLCTYEVQKDTCQGDSGGPLVWLNPSTNRYTLIALVSYGNGCARASPGVNTDVGSYMDWINQKVAESKPGQEGVCIIG